MKTVPELIEMCLIFAADEKAAYEIDFFIEWCTETSHESSRKHAENIILCFLTADMIYEGEYK